MTLKHAFAISTLLLTYVVSGTALALTAEQTERLRCTAAFALVGSEQQRDPTAWEGFPLLTERGGRFIAFVGEGLMRETGRSRDDIRGEIGKAINAMQKEAIDAADPKALVQGTVRDCIVLMDRLMPAKP